MQTLKIALAATLLAAPFAHADTQTHSMNYSYSLATNGDVYPRLTLAGFDTEGGKRALERVEVRVQSTLSATIAIENMTSGPLSDWTLEGQHLVLMSMERENPKDFGPFAFLGGLNIESFTGTLAANDGVAGSGADRKTFTDSTTIDSLLEMDAGYLDFFSRGGEIVTVVGPFTESFLGNATLYDQELGTGDAVVQFADLSQTGTLSVIYHYSVVPEPTSLVGLAGCCLVRRRR